MTDTSEDERDVDFVLVEPDGTEAEAAEETGFVIVEDTDIVPAEDTQTNQLAVVEEAETGFVVRDPTTDETGFVLVRDTDLVPIDDPTQNYPAVIQDVETDFVLVESDDAESTDFVLVDDADVDHDTGLVPVHPDEFALDTPAVDPKRNGHH
jgi:hypothetical protein